MSVCPSSDALRHFPPQRCKDLAHLGLFLSGVRLVLQAEIGDGHSLDALALGKNGLAAPEMDIGRRQVLQAFMGAGVVVVGDKSIDALFEFARRKAFSSRMRFFIV